VTFDDHLHATDIRSGCYEQVAARRAGISERANYNRLKRGEAGEAPYVQFVQAIREAEPKRPASPTLWQRHAPIGKRRISARTQVPEAMGQVFNKLSSGNVIRFHQWSGSGRHAAT